MRQHYDLLLLRNILLMEVFIVISITRFECYKIKLFQDIKRKIEEKVVN